MTKATANMSAHHELPASLNAVYESGEELRSQALETRRAKWEQSELDRMNREGRSPSNDSWKKRYKQPTEINGEPPYIIPNTWVWASAEEVCESVRDGTHDTPSYAEVGVPLVTSKNLVNGNIGWGNIKLISHKDHIEISKRSGVDNGDILFAMIGTVGNPVVVKKDRDFSIKNVGLFKKNENLVGSSYFKYWLESPVLERWLTVRLKGTTQKFAPLGLLRALPVPLAPLDQQKRIVAEIEKQFSRLDEAVANLKRVKANLKRYKAAVLKTAVEGRLVATSNEFDRVPLRNLIGRIHQGWSPKCDLNREPGPDEWAVITTTAVQPMLYLDGQGKPLPDGLEPRPHLEVKNGDFLVTRKGPRIRAGVACLVRSTRHRLMVCDTVYRFRCDDSKVIPEYLEIALNAPSVVTAIDRQKAGINESGVSLTHAKLGGIEIPVPPLVDQSDIVAEVDHRLSLLRETEAQVDANLQRAKSLRQAILMKAFSGLLAKHLSPS